MSKLNKKSLKEYAKQMFIKQSGGLAQEIITDERKRVIDEVVKTIRDLYCEGKIHLTDEHRILLTQKIDELKND